MEKIIEILYKDIDTGEYKTMVARQGTTLKSAVKVAKDKFKRGEVSYIEVRVDTETHVVYKL